MSPIYKSVIILSDKSSGSTILQNVLAKHPEINIIDFENFNYESKYWAYSASILDLSQPEMEYSHEFPIKKKRALKKLNKLFNDAGLNFTLNKSVVKKEDIFQGWELLSERFAPIFLEKSPHHLHSWNALKLMIEFSQTHRNVEVKFIGLIRNPIDSLYSMWKRWYAIPERAQYEWLRAYINLLKLKSIVGNQLLIIKYEDFINDKECLNNIFNFIGVKSYPEITTNIHNKSIQKWKHDNNFGFQLGNDVLQFAEKFYPQHILQNTNKPFWKFTKYINEPRFKLLVIQVKLLKVLLELKDAVKIKI